MSTGQCATPQPFTYVTTVDDGSGNAVGQTTYEYDAYKEEMLRSAKARAE